MFPRSRILCVDDHEDTGFMLKAVLTNTGYDVDTATTALQACELARAGRYALFILDNRFPDAKGDDVCRDLQVVSRETPIVFYSGAAETGVIASALEAGARAYVPKPDIEKLLATVKAIVDECPHS